jgi:lipopolysaccharide/colanic/teichoic acid biosynthesis glycosyltransferase
VPLSTPRSRQWRYLALVLSAIDLLCLLGAILIAGWLASRPPLGATDNRASVPLLLTALPLLWAVFLTQGLYSRQNLLGGTHEYAAVFRACTYGVLGLVVLTFAVHAQVSRAWVVFSWLLAIIGVGGGRFAVRRVAYRLRRQGYFTTRIVVVGANEESVSVARQLAAPGSGVQVVGFLDDYVASGTTVADGMRVLGTPASLVRVAAKTGADEAILVPQALPWERVRSLLAEVIAAPNGLKLHLSAGFDDLLTAGVSLRERNHVPLLAVNKARLGPVQAGVKVVLDRLLAAVLLLVCGPVFLIEWLSARGSSPFVERHPVIGRFGRRFDQLSFPARSDHGGELVRKLPGLVNVLFGQLSLIGPRPIPDRGAQDAGPAPTIRPGLTGPWRRADDPREQAILDLYYIRSYSVWLDLHVLFGRLLFHLRRLSGIAAAP